MSEDKDSGIPMWVCMVVTLCFGIIVAIAAWGITDRAWQAACVKRGVAKWTVTDEHGRIEWDWISK